MAQGSQPTPEAAPPAPPPREEILTFADATFRDPQARYLEMSHVNFSIAAGELCLYRLEIGGELTPLADAALGMLHPLAGDVLLRGRAWRRLAEHDLLARRGRIGRVFEGRAWIGNLNVLENILLPMRQHSTRDDAQLLQQALHWARRFGFDEIPSTRPDRTPAWALRLFEWVRALALEPELLILENPTRGVPLERLPALHDAIRSCLERGAAVLLLSTDSDVWSIWQPRAAHKFALVQGKQRAVA